MSDPNTLPTPPWWNSRESRHAARDEERRQRRQQRAEERAARHGKQPGLPSHDPVTPESVAEAALHVIDTAGLDGLTVRALAQELGVGTMTLYWYVKNKDEVLDLVSDRLLAGVSFPPSEQDWRVSARQGAIAVRAALLRHANAVQVLVNRGSFGPNGLRMLEESLAVFRAAGFDDNDAADAYFTISNFVTGFCTFETASPGRAGHPGMDMRSYGQVLRQYIESLPADRFPNLHAAAPRIFSASLNERFEFGVDCLIAGFEARLRAAKTASSSSQS
jgi:TetR/AcrR family tetracycline transcriptional repressor